MKNQPDNKGGSNQFTSTIINRDSLVPIPIEADPESLIHRDVCNLDTAKDFSKSRGHPVFPISLPSKSVSYSVGDLDSGQTTSNHRHAYESLIYVIEGKGYTVIEGTKMEWKAGDAIYVPPWNWHQHFSEGTFCRYITATNLPLLASLGQTVVREEEK